MDQTLFDATPEAARRVPAATTFPTTLVVAIVARCLLPTLLRCFGSEDASADTLEELLSCTYTVLALMLFSQHAQRPKGGPPAPSMSPMARSVEAPGSMAANASD